jgi:sialic acid synthase SpsE
MNKQVKYIAEIGSNHNNNSNRIEKLIRTAKSLGFWAVKFQLFRAEHLFWEGNETAFKNAINNELDLELINWIENVCIDYEIKFICAPFDMKALNYIKSTADHLKISSFDILRKDLISTAYNSNNNTLFISTGLATYTDIREMIDYVNTHNAKDDSELLNICLMHCVSKYPTKKSEANIQAIWNLKQYFSLFVEKFGYSDHTVDIDAVCSAIYLGAEYVELHFDLDDKKGNEYNYGHCWTPSKINKLFEKQKKFTFKENTYPMGRIQSLYGVDKLLTKDELGERADPSDGLRPMLYKRVKKSS